jgi:class 3 adenylate cyclase
VGFTPLSARLKPEEVVAILNELFTLFDRLAEAHGVEKIKTIGDAYMAVGGVPLARGDHAEAVAALAMEMQASIEDYNARLGASIKLRIGICSGPVVAGVIGLRKFAYDLWGDTVNTAARMEAHGVPGEIQVSESTWRLLAGRCRFQERGMIEIKGKGPMPTWFLKGPLES